MIDQTFRQKPKVSIEKALDFFQKRQGKIIVEIGSMRQPLKHDLSRSDLPCCNDGHSSAFWANTGHYVYSIDVDPECVKITDKTFKKFKAEKAKALLLDGIEFLKSFTKPIDLLYLDGWDVGSSGYAEKHLEAYLIAKKNLHDKSIILIDDTDVDMVDGELTLIQGGSSGKGKLLIPELQKDGFEIVFAGRQTLLVRPE